MKPTMNGNMTNGSHAPTLSESTNGDSSSKSSVDESEDYAGFLLFDDPGHHESVLSALDKMRKNRHFCDVVLHVGSAEIAAHRCVLGAASSFLLELFTTEPTTGPRESVVTYKLNGGFDKASLQLLVDYAYTGKLAVPESQVRSVFAAAGRLRMDRVIQACARHLIATLNADSCLQTRALPGVAKDRNLLAAVDKFIAARFSDMARSNTALHALGRAKVQVLSQSRQDPTSLCRLALDWAKKNRAGYRDLCGRTHMLYLALDNSLQDCTELPAGDACDTQLVQEYKRQSAADGHTASSNGSSSRKRNLGQPSRPRVLLYSRDISGEEQQPNDDQDWNLIATAPVGEHTFLALVTLGGHLATMSVQLRWNPPVLAMSVEGPIAPEAGKTPSDTSSKNEADLYCSVSTMSVGKCAAGCAPAPGPTGLIVCGGYDRTECLRTAERYEPDTNTWHPLPNMREHRGRFQIAVVRNTVYAIGGSNGHTELDSVEALDLSLSESKWKKITTLPLARSNLGVCTLNDKIYCIGGWNGQAGIKQCDVFDASTNTWSSIAPLKTGRYQAGVTSHKNLVYAIGGTDGWNCLSSVETYDPDTNTWTFTKPLTMARRGCGAVVFQGRLYVVGGSDGSHSLDTTEAYCEKTKCWVSGPTMTKPRANVGVAVVDDRLYAVGGFSGKTFLNTIEYLDANSNEWTTFIPKEKDSEEVFNNLKNLTLSVSTEGLDEEIDNLKLEEKPNGKLIDSNKDNSYDFNKSIEGQIQNTTDNSYDFSIDGQIQNAKVNFFC